MVHVIRKGLDIPIAGVPVQQIVDGPQISSVGLVADDYVGMRPTMLVEEGESVRLGQPVFADKKCLGVVYTAPCSGRVESINRGAKRRFTSLIIQRDGDRQETFPRFDSLDKASLEDVRANLVRSGLWTAFRTRPYSKVPAPESKARSIFVTAMDTSPLSAEPELIIEHHKELFIRGLHVLTKVNDGKVFVCTRTDSRVPGRDIYGVHFEEFQGPHPAGLAGTHIHFLDPVSVSRVVWYINYQDVIAMGHLFATGTIMTERTVALGGPVVGEPKLYRTCLGANLLQLTQGKINSENFRIVSGSILCGRRAQHPVDYLGRYHLQVSVLPEGNHREFLGWQKPGFDKYSVTRAFAGSMIKGRRFALDTNIHGSRRAMVPIGTYERIMPLDILPTHLLRAIIVGDTEQAQALGVLELDEEDLGLCTFVCPGKYEYGSILRENLTRIEKEG